MFRHYPDFKRLMKADLTDRDVKSLLRQGADKNGDTALIWAAARGWGDVVRMLLDEGANIEDANSSDRTALAAAAGNGHIEVVQLLLDRGANVNKSDSYGATALFSAVGSSNTKIVRLLIDKGADIEARFLNYTPLMWAAYNGQVEAMRFLIEKSADLNKRDSEGNTVLTLATRYDRPEMIQMLLDKGVNIDEGNSRGDTALNSAAQNDHAEIAGLLIDKGADINQKNNDGRTPLISAAYKNHKKIVRLLLDQGADIDEKDNNGYTALSMAENYSRTEIIPMLKGAVDLQKQQAAEKARVPVEFWAMMGSDKVVHIDSCPAIERKLTEIFNFSSRERLIITENMKTNAEAATQPVRFDDLPPAVVEMALTEFKKQGGIIADEDFVLRGNTQIDKPRPGLKPLS